MFEIIMLVSLGAVAPATQSPAKAQAVPAVQTAQYSPCVWPNKCKQEEPRKVAQYSPCVWPNKCTDAAPVIAQYSPCVWPNKCAQSRPAAGEISFLD